MFREIREIRTREKLTERDRQEEEGWRKIKPENGMTKEEADKFWKELFSKRIEVEEE